MAGYGLRRLLVSADREAKCILSRRERKALQSDHVILVPGPTMKSSQVRYQFTADVPWSQRGQRTSIVDFISTVCVVSSRGPQQISDSYPDQ